MNQTKAILHLYEVKVPISEFRAIPEDHQVALIVLSHAVSELNVLLRATVAANNGHAEDDAIRDALIAQKMVFARLLSAKLFEAVKFVGEGRYGIQRNSPDQALVKLAKRWSESFLMICAQDGFYLAERLRNESTNHYAFRAAKSNLGKLSPKANLNLYLSDLGGNCFYPMGEEALFVAGVVRATDSVKFSASVTEAFGVWLQWITDALAWLAETHSSFMNELLLEPRNLGPAYPKHYFIHMDLVKDTRSIVLPIALRKAET